MLLRFRTANIRSLRDEQELSFVVPPGGESDAARTVRLSDGKQLAVYPVVGVFGANASGKSNVITALKKMRSAVLDSYGLWTSYTGVPEREPFVLDAESAEASSFYEADFVLEDGVRWTYGFELGDRRVETEWLHAYPKGRRQVWLDRDASRESAYDFPGDRVQDRARLARSTRPNALLLSRAASDNHPQLSRIYDWFRSNLWDITPETELKDREAYTARQLLDRANEKRVRELLRVADLGIQGAEVERRPGAEAPRSDCCTEAIPTARWPWTGRRNPSAHDPGSRSSGRSCWPSTEAPCCSSTNSTRVCTHGSHPKWSGCSRRRGPTGWTLSCSSRPMTRPS